jgi:hypothetical protein
MIDLSAINANQVIPGLWQGAAPQPGSYPVDILVLSAQSYQPAADQFPGVQVLRVPLRDVEKLPDQETLQTAIKVAAQVAEAIRNGKKVLVTCQKGWNRSGFIDGLVLRILGASPDDTVRLLRAARGSDALSNPVFEAYVRAFQPPKQPTTSWVGPIIFAAVITTGLGLLWFSRRTQPSRRVVRPQVTDV